MATTITKLFSTGILQSSVLFDEITYSSVKISPSGIYAAQFDEINLAAGTAERKTNTGTYLVSGYFDEVSGPVNSNGLSVNFNATNRSSYNGTGTTWHNLANNGVDINAVGGVNWANTYTGAFTFDGTGYFPNINISTLGSATTATIEMWANIPASAFSGGGMPVGFSTYDVWINNGLGFNTFASDLYGISNAQITSLGLAGNWKHYVFVMNTGSYTSNQMWINGANQSLSQQAGTINTPSCVFGSPQYIQVPGHSGATSYLIPMTVGLVRAYNRQLSPAEILDNFNSNRSVYGV
jgi:hypothetical protein